MSWLTCLKKKTSMILSPSKNKRVIEDLESEIKSCEWKINYYLDEFNFYSEKLKVMKKALNDYLEKS